MHLPAAGSKDLCLNPKAPKGNTCLKGHIAVKKQSVVFTTDCFLLFSEFCTVDRVYQLSQGKIFLGRDQTDGSFDALVGKDGRSDAAEFFRKQGGTVQ